MKDDVKAMCKLLEEGDHDGLRRLAHQMKDAGCSYGYQTLTDAAKILEDAAISKNIETCKIALDKFEVLCLAVYNGRNINKSRAD